MQFYKIPSTIDNVVLGFLLHNFLQDGEIYWQKKSKKRS